MNKRDESTEDRPKPLRRRPALTVVLTCLAVALAGSAVGIEPNETKQPALGVWSSELPHDSVNWPHSERDSRIVGTEAGLRVEVAAERRFAIAAMSGLGLRNDLGQIRVRVAEMGGGATWFVPLYGELRQTGRRRTAAIAQDEAAIDERVFSVDPRLRQLPEAPLQLQLGVEGPPGAFIVVEDVAFLPPTPRPNRHARQHFQPGQKDSAAVEWMPNLRRPLQLGTAGRTTPEFRSVTMLARPWNITDPPTGDGGYKCSCCFSHTLCHCFARVRRTVARATRRITCDV